MAILKDYKYDDINGFAVENGAPVFVEDQEVIKQQIIANLKLVTKDWFLDFTLGIGYFDENDPLLGSNTLSVSKETEIRAAVTRVNGVEQILELNYSITNNILFVNIVALSIFGEVEAEAELGI